MTIVSQRGTPTTAVNRNVPVDTFIGLFPSSLGALRTESVSLELICLNCDFLFSLIVVNSDILRIVVEVVIVDAADDGFVLNLLFSRKRCEVLIDEIEELNSKVEEVLNNESNSGRRHDLMRDFLNMKEGISMNDQ
mmetsp:Transcript_18576/g.21447  ORF Transcript_18576/g.21447 Transcript_18576/m.21447 type:complete len:136 (+) Transcript_18576:1210-1617(+)